MHREPHGLHRSFLSGVKRSEEAIEAASSLQGGYRFWRPKVFSNRADFSHPYQKFSESKHPKCLDPADLPSIETASEHRLPGARPPPWPFTHVARVQTPVGTPAPRSEMVSGPCCIRGCQHRLRRGFVQCSARSAAKVQPAPRRSTTPKRIRIGSARSRSTNAVKNTTTAGRPHTVAQKKSFASRRAVNR